MNNAMVMEVLQLGKLVMPPEPSPQTLTGLVCRMQRLVAGVTVAVQVAIEFPAPGLVVVTVIDF